MMKNQSSIRQFAKHFNHLIDRLFHKEKNKIFKCYRHNKTFSGLRKFLKEKINCDVYATVMTVYKSDNCVYVNRLCIIPLYLTQHIGIDERF